MRKNIIYRLLTGPLLVLWLLADLQPICRAATAIQVPLSPFGWQVSDQMGGVSLLWQVASEPVQARATYTLAANLARLPTVRYGGYQLPLQLETVLLDDSAPAVAQVQQIESSQWLLPLQIAEPLSPPSDLNEAASLLLPPAPRMLPSTPVFLLREGRVRGQRIGVIAFSPLYQEAGVTKLALTLKALWPGAQTLTQPLSSLMPQALPTAARLNTDLNTRTLVAASRGANGEAVAPPGPSNPAAAGFAIKVRVSQAGLQHMAGSALLTAGLSMGTALAQLHLAAQGHELALEIRDADGLLDSASELRFYAPPAANSMGVGDRWNSTETDWLTIEATPGLRMQTRAALTDSAPVRHTAFASGIAEPNNLYESTMPGADGDHWFAAKMSVGPSVNGVTTYDAATFDLNPRLPLTTTLTDTASFTLTGNARTIATHNLQINWAQTIDTFTWTNQNYYENWQRIIVSTTPSEQLHLILIAGLRPSDLRIDKIYWRQPISLQFAGQGAFFSGAAGTWRYHLSNVPTDGTLYDITDPRQPQIIQVPWGTDIEFTDGPQAQQYLLAGLGTVTTPQLSEHHRVTFTANLGADVLYITPAALKAALAPLVAYRQQQGYQVRVVDVQDIYDAWSYGQVAPDAIRNLLRYVTHYGQPAPIAAILVGDATTDPRDYLGKHNPDLIPAYLANVDPWQGEAACENCYAQLDDDNPLDGLQDPGFLIDIWLGRFSVQNADQLKVVVGKILQYETQPLAEKHYTSLYVADDYIHPDGTIDAAGNFAYDMDLVVTGDPAQNIPPLQSPNLPAVRVYYDPDADGVTQPWREPNAVKARLRVIDEFAKGPGLVSFNGHANHYQWATTVTSLPEPYLFGINDIYLLHNFAHLPIVLEMTCYTAQFVQVSATGTTMDEIFQTIPDGGAAAIWGAAGLTVGEGQKALMRGFQAKLWRLPPLTAKLGELTEAGYFDLFQNQACCQEVGKVYLLLGDPLTQALVWAPRQIFLPIIQK